MDAINALPLGELRCRQHAAEKVPLQMGITFNVYGDVDGAERIFPFDVLPRIVPELPPPRTGKTPPPSRATSAEPARAAGWRARSN